MTTYRVVMASAFTFDIEAESEAVALNAATHAAQANLHVPPGTELVAWRQTNSPVAREVQPELGSNIAVQHATDGEDTCSLGASHSGRCVYIAEDADDER